MPRLTPRRPRPVAPVADQLRPKVPKLAALMDAAEEDVLAYMDFPPSTGPSSLDQPIERLNGEIKRRTDVVGIFPNDAAVVRLIGAILLEQSDEWATQRSRYMTLETISAVSDTPRQPAAAALTRGPARQGAALLHHDGTRPADSGFCGQ